jgi:hypothetical protein
MPLGMNVLSPSSPSDLAKTRRFGNRAIFPILGEKSFFLGEKSAGIHFPEA